MVAPPLQHFSYRGRRLLFDCCVSLWNCGPLRPMCIIYIYILLFESPPKSMLQRGHTCFPMVASPLQHLYSRGCQLLFDCCVSLLMGGCLTPRCILFLCFFCRRSFGQRLAGRSPSKLSVKRSVGLSVGQPWAGGAPEGPKNWGFKASEGAGGCVYHLADLCCSREKESLWVATYCGIKYSQQKAN